MRAPPLYSTAHVADKYGHLAVIADDAVAICICHTARVTRPDATDAYSVRLEAEADNAYDETLDYSI